MSDQETLTLLARLTALEFILQQSFVQDLRKKSDRRQLLEDAKRSFLEQAAAIRFSPALSESDKAQMADRVRAAVSQFFDDVAAQAG